MCFEKALLPSLSIAEGDHNQLTIARGYITNGTQEDRVDCFEVEIRRREPAYRLWYPGSLARFCVRLQAKVLWPAASFGPPRAAPSCGWRKSTLVQTTMPLQLLRPPLLST